MGRFHSSQKGNDLCASCFPYFSELDLDLYISSLLLMNYDELFRY